MRLPGSKRLRQSVRWLKSRLVRHGLILGYHRVAGTTHDPYAMCVSPQNFAAQLAVLRQQANPLSLADMVKALHQGHLPERSVALTFDDGYADMLYQVKPLLEAYRTPATFFITTGHPGGEFWWDALDRIVTSAPQLPDQLQLATGDTVDLWSGNDTPDNQQRLLWTLYKKLLPLPASEREQAMAQLRDGHDKTAASDDRRAMTVDELVELAGSDLVTIGAHTVTHPLLAALPVDDQEKEIRQSKDYLEEVLGQPVTRFSYPNGSKSETTVGMVKENGFTCACTSDNDVIWRGSDPFQLPRFWVRDWDETMFSEWLRRWLIC